MADLVQSEPRSYQKDAVDGIQDTFGDTFVYLNDRGHYAIDNKVLDEFNKLTKDTVVWSRRRKYWRVRYDDDEPGRNQRY